MDGCYVGKTKPENRKTNRKDLRLAQNSNLNKRCVMVARQRANEEGFGSVKTVTAITKSENSYAIDSFANNNIVKNSTIHSDGATGYDNLSAWFYTIKLLPLIILNLFPLSLNF